MGDELANGWFPRLFTKIKPYFLIICLQFGYAGMYIVTMVSLKSGMSHWVLVVYRHAVATIAIAPFAFFIERKIRPKMTFSIFIKIAVLGLLEPVIDQNLYYVGMKYTSATFAAATVNILPALTFVLALFFRLEKVKMRTKHGMAKVVGTVITVTGAMVMTFYKGPIFNLFSSHGVSTEISNSSSASGEHWPLGTSLLLGCILGWSMFFILQSITLKEYPAELSLAAMICFMGMLEGAAVALVMEKDWTAWIIGFDSKLLAAVYTGVICSGIAYYIQGVVSRIRGPVFVTAFSPLSMIITAILSVIILAEQIHIGTLIGAIIIVFGLYSVVWGKSKDPINGSTKVDSDDEQAYQLPVVNSVVKASAPDERVAPEP